MTTFAFLLAAIVAGFHTASYALYEKKQGNTLGACGVLLVVLASISVSLYRVLFE